MDYKEKYNTIIERAKTAYNGTCKYNGKDLIEYLLNGVEEINDSEDERIRKAIINVFAAHKDYEIFFGVSVEDILAYLAKQKEQPTNEEMLRTLRAEYEKGVADTIAKYEQKEQNFDTISSWLRDHASRYVNGEFNEFHHCVEYDGTIDVERLIADLKVAVDGGIFDVDAAFDTREPRDNWEYIKEFCDKFGRMPKDVDELDALVSYVMDKKQKEQKLATLDESVELGLDRALCIVKNAKGNLPAYQTDDGIYECDSAIRTLENLLKNGIEQKPTENISQLTVQGKGVYKICPRCKERMVRDNSKVYTSMPPKYGYKCPKCGETEFDTVMYDSPEMEEQKSIEDAIKNITKNKESATNFLKSAGIMDDNGELAEMYRSEQSITDSALKKIKIAITNCKKLSEHYKDTEENFHQYYGGKAEGLQLALAYFGNENEQSLEECVPDSVKFDEGFKTGREVGFREGIESVKLAEWSEEDEKMRIGLISVIREIKMQPLKRLEDWDGYIHFLESIHPQPKQEWSEEDEKMINTIICDLERHGGKDDSIYSKEISWLKSLHPQPKQELGEVEKKVLDSIIDDYKKANKSFCGYDGKIMLLKAIRDGEYELSKQVWCDEDDKTIDEAVECIERYAEYVQGGFSKQHVLDLARRVDSLLRPQPHWKPSEEQMKALNEIINTLAVSMNPHESDYLFNMLNGLQKNLKKL